MNEPLHPRYDGKLQVEVFNKQNNLADGDHNRVCNSFEWLTPQLLNVFVAYEYSTKNSNLYTPIFSIFIPHGIQVRLKIVKCGRIRKH